MTSITLTARAQGDGPLTAAHLIDFLIQVPSDSYVSVGEGVSNKDDADTWVLTAVWMNAATKRSATVLEADVCCEDCALPEAT